MSIRDRKKLYYSFNSKLSELSNADLIRLVNKGKISEGWGGNSLIKVDQKKVFVKTVPLTQKEYENSFDTRNILKLPLFYNYGVGSAGLGAFRELVAHIKTTNWVLDDSHHSFPLMYHYRIVKNTNAKTYSVPGDPKKYVENWNNSKSIERYVSERKTPPYEIILCLEYFPNVMHEWIESNSNKIQVFSKKIYKTFDFLKQNKIIHFDAHWRNILVDDSGEPYLTDFGLVLDYSYCSTEKEKEFFNNHSFYDHSQYTGYLIFLLEIKYQSCSKSKKNKFSQSFGVKKDLTAYDRCLLMLENLDSILKINLISIDKSYVVFLKKHKNIIVNSNQFFMKTRFEKKKLDNFDKRKMRKLLTSSDVIK